MANDCVHPSREPLRNTLPAPPPLWAGLICATQLLACGSAPNTPAQPPIVQVEPVRTVRVAADPTFTGKPHVAIEMGMHTAVINDAHADAAGRFLVTASDDRTTRVWSLADGRLLRTLRLPVEGVDGGKAYTATISPDGRHVAAAGYTKAIFIFDRRSGKLVRRLDKLPNSIKSLRYSPDGKVLVAGCASEGIAVYKTAGRYALIARDRDYEESVYGLTFNSLGRLATASEDDSVRVYDAQYQVRLRRRLGDDLFRIAYSPDDQLVAVGAYDAPRIHVLDGDDLSTVKTHDLSQYDSGNLADVAWSGQRLLGGGEFDRGGQNPVVVIDEALSAPLFWPGGMDSLGAMVPLPDGRLVAAMTDPRIVLFDAQGKTVWARVPDKLNMYNVPLALSADGMSAQIARFPRDEASAGVTIRLGGAGAGGHALPRTTAPGLAIEDWKDTGSPSVGGRPLALQSYEVSRSLAIAADGQRFVLGTEWQVILFDRRGEKLWSRATPSVAWAVNLSADGRLVVAAIDDGRLEWYRASDGELLLSHFRSRDGRWVSWTPEGFFDASPGGDTLVGYHFNRGRTGTPAFMSAKQLRKSFYHPELMAVSLSDDRSAIERAVARYGDVNAMVAPNKRAPGR